MKNKLFALTLATFCAFTFALPSSYAVGAKQATASLLLPATGQAMNGDIGTTKSKIMVGVEVAAITTIAVLGTVVGGGVVWAGLGPLLANHLWSAADAYGGANNKNKAGVQQQIQMGQAQQTLEYSRQRRFDREESSRSNLRARINQAGEQAYSK